jgi:periplasmic divalent cation tolerance protein
LGSAHLPHTPTCPHVYTFTSLEARQTSDMQASETVREIVIALSTCPDDQTAAAIAEALVREGLATCINRVGGVRSTYFWDGRLQDEGEILLIIKTCKSRLAELQARLEELHPYELPELVVLPVVGGNEAYLEWVRKGVNKGMAG